MLAFKIASGGQKPEVKASIFNDFGAIATYAHYVDAMVVDNECQFLLTQGPLRTELKLKARIFSPRLREQFLDYLSEMEARTPADVRLIANELYGPIT